MKRFHVFICALLVFNLLNPAYVFCQDEEAAEKAKAKIKVEYFKNESNIKLIKATVTSKPEKKWEAADNVTISFYRDSVAPTSLIKKVNTDVKGIGTAELPDEFSEPDSQGLMKFIVAIEPNDKYKTTDEIEVKDLTLSVNFKMEDSIGIVTIKASEPGTRIPVADLDINVYVKRMFSLLKIGSETTDEEGKIEVEIPGDIPADSKGLIEIITKLEDDETYGTVSGTCGEVECGIPLIIEGESRAEVRALWSPNAPLWMVITFAILMTGVWGHFVYIIYSLFRINKIGANSSGKGIAWNE